ncbi:MAG: LysR family transcriptional regulator [Cyanothece sp. SIO1E1]|nr:LysR family transcriptional regulator [Cyanothece sp. SIO1E1]
MDLYQIKYFLAIAETGSFTKAADRLFVSQPSLSTGIRKLEQELDVTLFNRGGRGVVMTPAGKLFLEKAQQILTNYQSAVHDLRDFQARPTLRLGTLCTVRISSFSKLVQTFRAHHPNVTIELRDSHLDELRNDLEQDEIDLMMTVLGERENTNNSQFLFQQRLLLAVPHGHPFAQKQTVHVQELDGQPFIERVKCEILHQKSSKMFADAKIQPQVVYRANNEEWVISLIQAGLGMSIMPEWQNVPGITYVPIAEISAIRTVGLKWRVQGNLKLIDGFRAFATRYEW